MKTSTTIARPTSVLRSLSFPVRGVAAVLLLAALVAGGCSSVNREPATARLPETPGAGTGTAGSSTAGSTGATTPERASGGLTEEEILAMPPGGGVSSEAIDPLTMDLADLNASGALRDVLFNFDSADLDGAARAILEANAAWLLRYPTVEILVEGHCDERGTVEYNLALGEERARSARDYLASLGVASDRMRTITYGKEFPLDPAHDEEAWRINRRAHLEIVAR